MTLMETTDGTVPADTFAVRLAIVRAVQGWNYDQAEAATGINSESWRTWEKGMRRCSDQVGVARIIAEATGMSAKWLAFGGSLAVPPQTVPRRRRHTERARAGSKDYKSGTLGIFRNRALQRESVAAQRVNTCDPGQSRRAA